MKAIAFSALALVAMLACAFRLDAGQTHWTLDALRGRFGGVEP